MNEKEQNDNRYEISGPSLEKDEQGAIGYILAWLLGIPASVLFVIFLLRGCE
jgi:hypothetical protein